jgi:geranylgeranyl transferase type-2 subunit alpha
MHGVRREAYKREKTPKERIASRDKTRRYIKLSAALLAHRRKRVYTEDALKLTETMLSRSVDFYTIWNYRREILLSLMPELAQTRAPDAADAGSPKLKAEKAQMEKELQLVAHGLKNRNPKSYSLWHHREWVVRRGLSDLGAELELCRKFLSLDERNFHCWAYRRFVADRAGAPLEGELDFTLEKIEQNFSNYSAWHHRMSLLPRSLAERGGGLSHLLGMLETELELVQQAIFCEPDDQACWLHQRWTFEWAAAALEAGERAGAEGAAQLRSGMEEAVDASIANCRELVEMEGEAKWALVSHAHLLGVKARLVGGPDAGNSKFGARTSPDGAVDVGEEAAGIVERLKRLDPAHAEYYAETACRV